MTASLDIDCYLQLRPDRRSEFDAWLLLHDTSNLVIRVEIDGEMVRIERLALTVTSSAIVRSEPGSARPYLTEIVELQLAAPAPSWLT